MLRPEPYTLNPTPYTLHVSTGRRQGVAPATVPKRSLGPRVGSPSMVQARRFPRGEQRTPSAKPGAPTAAERREKSSKEFKDFDL